MIRYTFGEDGFYKKIPHQNSHQELYGDLGKDQETHVVGSPTFPFKDAVMFIETCKTREELEEVIK